MGGKDVDQPIGNKGNDPTEAIVILFDTSGSMGIKFVNQGQAMSRMGATNAFFSAFAEQTAFAELDHIIQLFTFSNFSIKECEFNDNYNGFI